MQHAQAQSNTIELVPEELYRRRDASVQKLLTAGKVVKQARLEFETNRSNLLPYWQRLLQQEIDSMIAEGTKYDTKQKQLSEQQAALLKELDTANKNPATTDAQFDALGVRVRKNIQEWIAAREHTAVKLSQTSKAMLKELESTLKADAAGNDYLAKAKIGYDEQAPKKLVNLAQKLGKNSKEKYEEDKDGTKCNIFLRNFARELVGIPLPEFAGKALANDMFDNLKASKNWQALDLQRDKQAAFQKAQAAANEGKLVVIAYKSLDPKHPAGHVAVVVPNQDGFGAPGSWDVPIPYIAQAGETVFAKDRMSVGFSVKRFPNMEIFILAPPSPKGASTGTANVQDK